MAKFTDGITDEHKAFIAAQPMFFVATAPDEGRINLSPKGLDGSFAVIGPNRVAFLNLTGSGNETAAHLLRDDRVTIMFCAFAGAPKILRLYGRGRAVHARDPEWEDLLSLFSAYPAVRQVVVVDVDSVNTSCGFGVPLMALQGQRTMLPEWAERKGPEGIERYQREKNAISFDGYPTGLFDDDDE